MKTKFAVGQECVMTSHGESMDNKYPMFGVIVGVYGHYYTVDCSTPGYTWQVLPEDLYTPEEWAALTLTL